MPLVKDSLQFSSAGSSSEMFFTNPHFCPAKSQLKKIQDAHLSFFLLHFSADEAEHRLKEHVTGHNETLQHEQLFLVELTSRCIFVSKLSH